MSIIKERIKFNGNNLNVKFNLDLTDKFLGYQQEIDNLTQTTNYGLINDAVDVEERRFKNSAIPVNSILFMFTLNGTYYSYAYTSAGFSSSEINGNSLNTLNSFYLFEYYNTYDINSQTKLFTTYLTKLSNGVNSNASFTINSANQLYYLYVPINYINTQLNSGITKTTIYAKISFYNAKNGQVALFFNNNYATDTTAKKMYFSTEINFLDKTWKFIDPSNLTAKQLWSSQDYNDKINNSFTKFNNEKQNYPIGNTFNNTTGLYE